MNESFLTPHQLAVVDRVLDGRPQPVVLLAPPGSGIGAVIAAISTKAIAEGAGERVLIVTRSRLLAQEFQQRLAESSPPVDAALVTGDSFRLFLASGLPRAGVILITAQLLARSDVAPAIAADPWSVVISDVGRGGGPIRSVLENIRTTRGKLFIDDRLETYPLSEHDRLISWYDLPRHELGLHPDREIELWEYDRSPEELRALKEFMRIIDESLPAAMAPAIRQNLVAAATSSPLAFEQVLMRSVRNSERRQVDEDVDDAQTDSQTEWRPQPAPVSALLALVDNIGADTKVGYLIDSLRTRKATHPRIVVFCRMSRPRRTLRRSCQRRRISKVAPSCALIPCLRGANSLRGWRISRSALRAHHHGGARD